MLNRSAVVVSPKQPYIEWAASLDDSGLAPSADDDRTVYLIPEYNDDVEAMEILSQAYDIIFEMELGAWHTEESAWPKSRTFAMFREWFEIEFYSLVDDLCGYELSDDELD
ncbi:MAG: hypothetical protein ACR2RB_10425 [Gammaproteobacteria bacterium]